MGFIIHFNIIFGTNLLTQRPSPDCCFLLISGFYRKGISNGVQTEWNFGGDIFGAKYARETCEPWNSAHVASTRMGASPPTGRAPCLVGPMSVPRCPPSSYIYTYVPRNHQNNRETPSSTAATFCSREIPSWGLFRHPVGRGFDHGGHLHQLYCPSDEAWVV